jgi:glycosyltransferase involved in cell wall biosynthesis
MKIAYFSPLNPVQSGISDYSEELLPQLAEYAEIDLYVDGYTPVNKEITGRFAVYPVAKFKSHAGRYDNFLFHMGNSAAHAYIYRALQETAGQGVLVLHDFVLHHFFIGQYLNNGKAPEYIRQMARHYGAEGETLAREVIKGRFAEALFGYPLNETAIEAARSVLVHSNYARNLIKEKYPDKTVGVARMGVPLPPDVSKADARARLGLPQNEFIIISLGHLNPYKRLDSVLWAFRAFRREFPASRLILVGSESPNYNVRAMITALGLEKSVQLTGYASFEAMQDYTAAADACVNLRYPTAGETSASLLRIMGAGRPVLVSRTGAFTELPDATCIKVDVDDAEEELLLEYLRLLARRPELAHALGQNARRHVAVHARPADAARDYFHFLSYELRAMSYEPEEVDNYQLSVISPEQEETISFQPRTCRNYASFILHPSSFRSPPTLNRSYRGHWDGRGRPGAGRNCAGGEV